MDTDSLCFACVDLRHALPQMQSNNHQNILEELCIALMRNQWESPRTAICKLIEECTPGANYIHVCGQNNRNHVEYHCSCSTTTESIKKKKESVQDQYKQGNTKVVTVKRQRTLGRLTGWPGYESSPGYETARSGMVV